MFAAFSAVLAPIARFCSGLVDRLVCVLGAVGLSQAPEFYQQYLQRLGGHLDEARRVLGGYEAVARQSGLTLRQMVEMTVAQPDKAVVRLGRLIEDAERRVEALAAADAALRSAGWWERPWVFLRHVDTDIAWRTWEVFKPAVPVTLEGVVYAAFGLVGALILYHGMIAVPGAALARRLRDQGNRASALGAKGARGGEAGVASARFEVPPGRLRREEEGA